MTKSAIDSFESLKPLSCLTSLVCVYLEHSPVAKVTYEYCRGQNKAAVLGIFLKYI